MAQQHRRFVPRLEAFDERALPSVTVSYSATDGVLTVRGDDSNDLITITDTGKDTAGSITVFDHGNPVFFSDQPVTRIEVFAGGGADTVDYWQSSDMTTNRTLAVDLGAGNDTFTAHLDGQNIADGSGLEIQALGRKGKDTLTLDANGVNLGAGAHLTVNFRGGPGKDAIAF
ncbi:MAG: hypothetical protein J2P46_15530, partial [Zavarzinella sp.]|nr:hypothetical protein [Zavarzinella sp.]